LRASANASPIASIAAAKRKFPASLITLARGGSSPATITPWPIASSAGRQRSSAGGGPAATIHRFFASAASGRPKTGAATYVCPAAVWAEHHVVERGVVRHHCDQHLGVAHGGGGTVGHDGVERLELVRTGAGAIVDRELVARLQQVPRHRQAHAAESDE